MNKVRDISKMQKYRLVKQHVRAINSRRTASQEHTQEKYVCNDDW